MYQPKITVRIQTQNKSWNSLHSATSFHAFGFNHLPRLKSVIPIFINRHHGKIGALADSVYATKIKALGDANLVKLE